MAIGPAHAARTGASPSLARISPSASTAICLLAPILCAASSTVDAQSGRGTRLACDEVEQRFVVEQRQLDARRLHFLLFDASERGCIDLMKRFIDLGASVDARDRNGNTALLIAARAGDDEAVELLLEHGAEVEQRNLAGSTALLQAAMASRRRTVSLLLDRGGDPNARNTRGITPLIAAAFNGNTRLVEMLLASGADPGAADETGKSALVYAAGKGFTGIVAMLLDAGVPVDARGGHELTALMWAAGHSNDVPVNEGIETVKLLLARGARIELVDDRGRSALLTAAERDHAEIAALLIERGADPAVVDRAGNTALGLAPGDETRRVIQAALDGARRPATQ